MSAITHDLSHRRAVRERDVAPRPGPMDRAYFLGTWALMVVGIVFVFSASYPVAGEPGADGVPGNPYWFLWQHMRYVGYGLVAMLAVSFVPPRVMRRISWIVFALAFLAVLATLGSPWAVAHNGAYRWLDPPGLPEFQPSELAKIALIALFANILARKDDEDEQPLVAYGTVLAVIAVMAIVLLKQPDLGMTMMFVAIALSMLFFGGMRLSQVGLLGAGFLGVGLLAASTEAYRWRRIIAFIDPEHASSDDRYHIVNMLIAQARGGITGLGLGMSPDKWHWLPAPHTDSIFSVIGGELGLVGAVALLAGIGLLTWRALRIACNARSPFAYYVASGVAAMLCLQSLAHIAVNTSCMPCTGLTLPFVSGGGTSLLSASIAVGMVLAVSRYESGSEP